MILSYFNEFVPNVLIEDTVTPKKGQTLIVKDCAKFAVELAAQSKQEDTDSEVKALRKVSRIIRRVLLKHKESHPTRFKSSVKYDRGSLPKILMTFLEHVIAGDRELNDFRSLDVQQVALSIINNFLYIVRSDKQVKYKPNSEESTFYHKDATL